MYMRNRYRIQKFLGLIITFIMIVSTMIMVAGPGTEYNSGSSPGESPLESNAERDMSTRTFYGWPKAFGNLKNTGTIGSYGPTTNDILWTFETGGDVFSSPTVASDIVYVGSWDKKLYALNAENGSMIWSYDVGDYIYSSPTYYNGMIFIGTGIELSSEHRKMVAVNAANGSLVWEHKFDGNIYGSPVAYDGVIYVGCADGYMYALDPDGNGDKTTSIFWKFETDGEIWSTPAIDGDYIYITSNDCKLYKIDITSRDEVWQFAADYHFEGLYGSPAVDEEGRVFFGSAVQPNGRFYAVSGATGKELWNISTGTSRYGICTTPAIHDDVVFIGSNNGIMYALNTSTGKELWKYTTGDTYNGIYSSATVANNLVYFGSTDGYMYCLKEATGDVTWSYKTGGGEYGVVSSPAVLNGMAYFGSNDWNVYAIGIKPTGKIQIDAQASPDLLEPGESATIGIKTFNSTSPLSRIELKITAPSGSLVSLDRRSNNNDGTTATRASSRVSVLIGSSDLMGYFNCEFTAPFVVSYTEIDIEIEASGFGLEKNTTSIKVIVNPNKQLEMKMTPPKTSYFKGEPVKVLLNVTAGGSTVDGATIHYTIAYNGQLISSAGFSDYRGLYTLGFTTPNVDSKTLITINTTTSKKGYVDVTKSLTLTALPQNANNFEVSVVIINREGLPENQYGIEVTVENKSSGKPVPGVALRFYVDMGSLDLLEGTTDENGKFEMIYTAGADSTTLPLLKVNASRMDYYETTLQEKLDLGSAIDDPDKKDGGKDSESFFSSPGFYAATAVIILVLIIATVVLMQARQKRKKMDKDSDEERVGDKVKK